MTSETTLTMQNTPQRALQRAAKALQLAGYKKIQTDAGAMMVSSNKWTWAIGEIPSWQRVRASITLVPVGEVVEVTIAATDRSARANQITGTSPASRAVARVVGCINPDGE